MDLDHDHGHIGVGQKHVEPHADVSQRFDSTDLEVLNVDRMIDVPVGIKLTKTDRDLGLVGYRTTR